MEQLLYINKENINPNQQSHLQQKRFGYVQQKATFYQDEDTRGFLQNNAQNKSKIKMSSSQSNFIHFWPNYPITHSMIELNNSLPKMEMKASIKPLNVNFEQSQIQMLERQALAVGQVFVVYVEKSNFVDFLEISCATFSIVEFPNQTQEHKELYGLTVAHLFMDTPQQIQGDYYRLIFVSLSENDAFEDFKKALQLFKAKKRKQILNQSKENGFKIKDFSKFLQDYLQNEDKYFKQQPIFQAYINYEFLEFRRELIFTFSESRATHECLLDPINGLQCLPSIDCCLLSFDDSFINYVLKQNIQPLLINPNWNHNSYKQNGILTLIGYHQVEGSILKKRDPTYLLNVFNNKSSIQPVDINKIINPHKTLQTGQFVKSNNYILTFESSTTQGSSGAPLIDINGNFIGINTGYFDDLTEYEDTEETQDFQNIVNFDKNVNENQQNYNKIKNYNCGIDIKHIIFYAFAKRDITIFQKIHQRDPSELRKSIPQSYQYLMSASIKKQKNKK